MDSTSVLEKMECEAFVGEVEHRVINGNVKYINFHNSDLLINEETEYEPEIEANQKSNIIGNLAVRLVLDGNIFQLNISIGSCNMHRSQCLNDSSMCTVNTKESTYVSEHNDIENENSVNFDHDFIFEYD